MNTNLYIGQVLLCLLTLVSIFAALTIRRLGKAYRMLLTLLPVAYGGIYYLLTQDESSIYAMLMGVVGMLVIVFRLNRSTEEENAAS